MITLGIEGYQKPVITEAEASAIQKEFEWNKNFGAWTVWDLSKGIEIATEKNYFLETQITYDGDEQDR